MDRDTLLMLSDAAMAAAEGRYTPSASSSDRVIGLLEAEVSLTCYVTPQEVAAAGLTPADVPGLIVADPAQGPNAHRYGIGAEALVAKRIEIEDELATLLSEEDYR